MNYRTLHYLDREKYSPDFMFHFSPKSNFFVLVISGLFHPIVILRWEAVWHPCCIFKFSTAGGHVEFTHIFVPYIELKNCDSLDGCIGGRVWCMLLPGQGSSFFVFPTFPWPIVKNNDCNVQVTDILWIQVANRSLELNILYKYYQYIVWYTIFSHLTSMDAQIWWMYASSWPCEIQI